MAPDTAELWKFLPLGYAITIVLEMPVLILGLSPRHGFLRRVFAGYWLTACTYPIVILVLPEIIWRPLGEAGYWPYVAVAEVFAPAAECALFWLAYWRQASATAGRADFIRDMLVIVAANLTSFRVGGWFAQWLGLLA